MVLRYDKNQEGNDFLENIFLVHAYHFLAKAQGGEITCPRPQG